MVGTEDLLMGDELGKVYYYSVEWGCLSLDGRTNARGVLIGVVDVHSQQICGIAWSPDGEIFATGANDNACCLFIARDILAGVGSQSLPTPTLHRYTTPLMGLIPDFVPNANSHYTLGSLLETQQQHMYPAYRGTPFPPESAGVKTFGRGTERRRWVLAAAVKAIAFCPWQSGLLATGGGSNDRAIHFFHMWSGACLATIDVQAQVTSLIWSRTRREIAATFGYAQPEHPYRIAVFSWPDCRQVVSIPWANDLRALYAIPYPGGPNESSRRRGEGEGGRWFSRTVEEGCIVVASSDESVKFHEVWGENGKSMGGGVGGLGWSDILELEEGVDKDWGEVIR